MNRATVDRLLADDAAAVRELQEVAACFSDAAWSTPLGPGRWTPAQHLVHVALAHAGIVADVREGRRAHLRGTARQRAFWRAAGLTQVLWLRRLPGGAEAPRELVPSDTPPPRAAVLHELTYEARQFDGALRTAFERTPGHRVLHPYFGPMSLRQIAVLSAVHTRHHARLLRRATRAVVANAARR